MIDISSSTAQSDQTSQTLGGNQGVSFGSTPDVKTLAIIAGILLAAFLIYKKV